MDESIVRHLDQPAKVLKLSEAIRIGSRIRPQAQTCLFRNGGSCVWGAAYEARGGRYVEGTNGFRRTDPIIPTEEFVDAEDVYRSAYGRSSWADNDAGMPREQIADRFEAIGL